MKTKAKMLFAFILNFSFAVLEFVGGLLTGSVAITSDAVHDFGDAFSIGCSLFLEKISEKAPDEKYTYGYARFSVLGSLISCVVLLVGSGFVIYNGVLKIINPTTVNHDGMLVFAVIGLVVNGGAFFITHGSNSLNQRATSLHMLEDLLGWIIVLVGAVVIKYTGFVLLDPVMSLALAVFIIVNACKTLFNAFEVFLEKKPSEICLKHLTEQLCNLDGVLDVHHLHVWSIDGQNNYATLHAVVSENSCQVKKALKEELLRHGVCHATVEVEAEGELCDQITCCPRLECSDGHCHHSHGHNHKHNNSHKHNHRHDNCHH